MSTVVGKVIFRDSQVGVKLLKKIRNSMLCKEIAAVHIYLKVHRKISSMIT